MFFSSLVNYLFYYFTVQSLLILLLIGVTGRVLRYKQQKLVLDKLGGNGIYLKSIMQLQNGWEDWKIRFRKQNQGYLTHWKYGQDLTLKWSEYDAILFLFVTLNVIPGLTATHH